MGQGAQAQGWPDVSAVGVQRGHHRGLAPLASVQDGPSYPWPGLASCVCGPHGALRFKKPCVSMLLWVPQLL